MNTAPKNIDDAKKLKLEDAIDLLEGAAKNKGHELNDLLRDRYPNMEAAVEKMLGVDLDDVVENASATLKTAAQKSQRFIQRNVKNVDSTVHSNPWAFIGGGVATGLVLGFLLGKK